MKLDLNKIKPKKSFHKKQNIPKPGLFWNIAVVLFFLIVIFGAIFGFILHKNIDKDPFYTEVMEVHSATEKEEKLDSSLLFFQERRDNTSEIIFSSAGVVDPAL